MRFHQAPCRAPPLHHLIDVAAHRAAFQVLLRQLPVARIAPRMLLKSCAMPPARRPIASSSPPAAACSASLALALLRPLRLLRALALRNVAVMP